MPRDLAASSHSRRPSLRKRRAATSADERASVWAELMPPAAVHDAALGEIRHELGNLFHKLYYWLDALQEARGPAVPPEATAGQMLEQTVRNLEDFLGTTLDYFRPVTLSPVPMSAGEVVAGVGARVEDVGAVEAPAPGSGEWATRTLLVDPTRLPAALDVAIRRLVAQTPAGTPVRVAAGSVRTEAAEGLVIELRLGEGAPRVPAFHTAAAALAWAIAQRVAALHGGDLAERTAPDGDRSVRLFLPYHA